MKAKLIGLTLIIAIAASIIATIILVGPVDLSTTKKSDKFQDWYKSGPFALNQKSYKIGESIFFIAEELKPSDSGSAIFVLPNGTTTYLALPFDGNMKSDFNYYFKPQLSKARNICSINDIIGDWTIVFKGTDYEPLRFTILNDTVASETGLFQKIC